MKRIAFAIALLAGAAFAQPTPSPSMYAFGVSANPGNQPSLAGTALYAQQVTQIGNKPTFAFGVLDVLPTTFKPVFVTTSFSAGIAQEVLTLGSVKFYIPLDIGFSYNGTNTGWNWSTGALAKIPIKGSFGIAPNFRAIKSSINNYSGYQIISGILLTFDK